MHDGNVKVREGAMKSLFSLAQTHCHLLKRYEKDANFWRAVIDNCQINDKLIEIIDYGVCKEVRDEGKALRLESFGLLQLLVKHISIDNQFVEELMSTALHRIGTSHIT